MAMTTVVRVDVTGKIQWNCTRARGGNWIAVCDPLGLTVQSETWGELMEDISLTLDGVLRDLLSSNELDRFLREHGWQAVGPIPTRPEDIRRFDVPFIPAMAMAS